MTRQRLDDKRELYVESLLAIVAEAFVTLILRRVGAKSLIGMRAQTLRDGRLVALDRMCHTCDDLPNTTLGISEAVETIVR